LKINILHISIYCNVKGGNHRINHRCISYRQKTKLPKLTVRHRNPTDRHSLVINNAIRVGDIIAF